MVNTVGSDELVHLLSQPACKRLREDRGESREVEARDWVLALERRVSVATLTLSDDRLQTEIR